MKRSRIIAALVIATTIFSMKPISVFASESPATGTAVNQEEAAKIEARDWINDSKGYIISDSNGIKHYVDNKGRLIEYRDLLANDGNGYYVGKDGVIQTGWFKDDKGAQRYADEAGVVKDRIIELNGKKYATDNVGEIMLNHRVWPEPGIYNAEYNCWNMYYAGEDGAFLIDKRVTDSDGNTLYTDKDGWIKIGLFYSTNNIFHQKLKLFADKEGRIQRDTIVTDKDGKMYYCDESGEIDKTGYIRMGAKSNYELCYADKDGVIQTGFFMNDEGKKCYAAKDGIIPESYKMITAENGRRYFINSMGLVATDCMVQPDGTNKSYHVDKDGEIQTGIFKDGQGKLWVADKDGAMQSNMLVTDEKGNMYYCGYDGAVTCNDYIRMKNEDLYYAGKDGVIQTGFFTNNEGLKCYADKSGLMPEYKKIRTEDGKLYFIMDMGKVAVNTTMCAGSIINGEYVIDKDGVIKTGFFKNSNNKLCYADKDGVVYSYQVVTAEDGKQYVCLSEGQIPQKAGCYTVGEKEYEVDDHGVVLREVVK